MILTAHQPVYLPWLGLFHKISLSDKFVYFNEVQYLPKDWMNRNKIKTNTGEIWLTVPVLRKGYRDTKTSELKINNSVNWQKKHFQTIKNNYGKAEYYSDYSDFFEEIYSKTWTFLEQLNEYMLKWFLNELKIKVDFIRASDNDFVGEKSELVLDMAKKLNAKTYIFGTLGKDYANTNDFQKFGINPIFQDYNHPKYKQLHGDFIPNLSIIDLLLNHGPKTYKILSHNNIVKKELEKN
jgi:hypothetical protein